MTTIVLHWTTNVQGSAVLDCRLLQYCLFVTCAAVDGAGIQVGDRPCNGVQYLDCTWLYLCTGNPWLPVVASNIRVQYYCSLSLFSLCLSALLRCVE